MLNIIEKISAAQEFEAGYGAYKNCRRVQELWVHIDHYFKIAKHELQLIKKACPVAYAEANTYFRSELFYLRNITAKPWEFDQALRELARARVVALVLREKREEVY